MTSRYGSFCYVLGLTWSSSAQHSRSSVASHRPRQLPAPQLRNRWPDPPIPTVTQGLGAHYRTPTVAIPTAHQTRKGLTQGRRHQVLFGGTDSWAPKPTYLQKFSFSSDFAHYFENFGKCKICKCVKKKDTEISSSGGTSPADFSTAGDASPRFRRPGFTNLISFLQSFSSRE